MAGSVAQLFVDPRQGCIAASGETWFGRGCTIFANSENTMIDFHCHLDLYPEPQGVVRECVSRGIYALAVTTTPSAWQGTSELVSGADRIRVALGLHPELARERRSELQLFEQLLPRTRYVGEIGLDGSPETRSFWADQKYVFDHILAACRAAGGKIMSIHSRRAITQVLDSLESHPGAGTPILHWYSGGSRELATWDVGLASVQRC